MFFSPILSLGCSNCATVDAQITFPSGLRVDWNGAPIGNIGLGSLMIAGDVGAGINMDAKFQVASVPHLTDFTKASLSLNSLWY